MTAWFGILDLETGILRYTNAGHDPALLLRTDGTIRQLEKGGRFLGQFEDVKYQFEEIQLQEEDMLLLYTDGIIEARDMLDVEYGFERLEQCLIESSFANASELVSAIRRNLESFCMGQQQRDDISMLAVDFRHSIVPEEAEPENAEPVEETVPLVGGRERLARDMGREAAILIRANRRTEAAAILEAALILVPGDPLLLLRSAALHIINKNWSQAESSLQGIINPLSLPDELLKQYERLGTMLKGQKT